ncbi:MAG: aconitase family protein, partial [Bacteroidota bacterium]
SKPLLGSSSPVGGSSFTACPSSFNRNFAKRNDGNPNTHSFVASPEIVTAMAIAGDLTFNPLTDTLVNEDGQAVKLDPPTGDELPSKGFDVEDAGFQAPAEDGSGIEISVNPQSERLELLTPFAPWDGKDVTDLKLFIKAFGKCTTDHISMAGPWLRYRGHLDNISNNLMLGAINAYTKQTGTKNAIDGSYDESPKVARAYRNAGVQSVIIGDENYGEGSSREHAAMEPRHMGVRAVIVKSFARIHETNLKKQGVLGLTFANPADYDKIQEDDTFTVHVAGIAPGSQVKVTAHHLDGSSDSFMTNHTYNEAQIQWLKAGSALNLIRQQQGL